MPDAEYQRIRYALIKAGIERKPKVKANDDRAAYMRQWRADRKASKAPPPATTFTSDEALNTIIMQRGRTLTQMMRTPICMWPAEWLIDND